MDPASFTSAWTSIRACQETLASFARALPEQGEPRLRPSRAIVSPNGSFLKVARDARCPILPSKSRGRSSRRESNRGRREYRTRLGPLPDGGLSLRRSAEPANAHAWDLR